MIKGLIYILIPLITDGLDPLQKKKKLLNEFLLYTFLQFFFCLVTKVKKICKWFVKSVLFNTLFKKAFVTKFSFIFTIVGHINNIFNSYIFYKMFF